MVDGLELNSIEQGIQNGLALDVKLDHGAYMPTMAHDSDSGYDLYSLEDVIFYPGQRSRVRTGVHLGLCQHIRADAKLEAIVRPRSSMTAAGFVTGIGTIDNGYTGSIDVSLYNATEDVLRIRKGDRIAQFVLHWVPFVKELRQVTDLRKTDRGEAGFGSTGKA